MECTVRTMTDGLCAWNALYLTHIDGLVSVDVGSTVQITYGCLFYHLHHDIQIRGALTVLGGSQNRWKHHLTENKTYAVFRLGICNRSMGVYILT